MIEKDSVRLLRECDAGVKMGISSIRDVEEFVSSPTLRQTLKHCKNEHERLGREIESELKRYGDEGKDPNPIAQGMSHIKTGVKLVMKESDSTIADLMTDGCNMGVKSLNKYLNEYKAADEHSKDITKKLIKLEENLIKDVHGYL